MIQKLCALALVALTLSPFTAPFGMCDAGPVGPAGAFGAPASDDGDPGLAIGPLSTKAGLLKIYPVAAFAVLYRVEPTETQLIVCSPQPSQSTDPPPLIAAVLRV